MILDTAIRSEPSAAPLVVSVLRSIGAGGLSREENRLGSSC